MTALAALETLELKRTALRVRRNVLRMFEAGRSGHLGGAPSAADILTALYFPGHEGRSRRSGAGGA